MKVEDRLRGELRSRAETVNPDLGSWSWVNAQGARRRRQRTLRVAVLSVLMVVVFIGGIMYAIDGSGSGRIETGTHRQRVLPTPTEAPTDSAIALPEFRNTADEFQAAVNRLTPRITYPGVEQTVSRGYLSSESVFCDASEAPNGPAVYERPAFTFPLGEQLTEQRITDGCLGSDILSSNGTAAQVAAGTHELCQTTQRPAQLLALDTAANRKVDKVVKPLVVFGATCAQRGHDPAGPGLLDELNRRRQAEIFMRAVPIDCPTRNATAAWVRTVSTDLLGRPFIVKTSPNPSLPGDGCAWPVQVDFDRAIAYVG